VQDDEWRVEIELGDDRTGDALAERLRALDLDEDARRRLGGRMIVTRDGPRVFLYAQSEEQAREAERVIVDVLASDDSTATVAVTRWHPIEEDWKDASLPLPRTEAEREVERRRHEEAEAREAADEGSYDWHVKLELPDRGDAVELQDRLAAEGLPVHRRWKYVTVDALTEETANELAGRLRDELPDEAEVWVEVNREDLPNPLFVLLGRWL
jgi:hypothetical protein